VFGAVFSKVDRAVAQQDLGIDELPAHRTHRPSDAVKDVAPGPFVCTHQSDSPAQRATRAILLMNPPDTPLKALSTLMAAVACSVAIE